MTTQPRDPSNGAALALDRDTVRTTDQDGRLHVATSNISKAAINPYVGSEIPNAEALGLNQKKIYRLLRHPDEIAKAAATFNNIPVLSRHVPVTADDHQPDLVVGSTGTDAAFEAPFLRNSLVIWEAGAIAGIESGQQRELSSAYRYDCDMTAGKYEGEPYDGVMRNLRGNHVALVETGRAGSDVVVGDEALKPTPEPTPQTKETAMATAKAISRKALLTGGALRAYLRPKLAQDQKVDIRPIVADLTVANAKTKRPVIISRLTEAVKGKLAKDADISDVVALLDNLDDDVDAVVDVAEKVEEVDPAADPNAAAIDAVPTAEIMSFLKGKLSDADMAKLGEMMKSDAAPPANVPPAQDDEAAKKATVEAAAKANADKDKPPGVTKAAMDAAIAAAVATATAKASKDAETATMKRLGEIRDAEREVRPYIGDLAIAQDTAVDVYRLALDSLGVDAAGVSDLAALKLVLNAQPKPGEPKQARTRMATDSAAVADFHKRFPGVSALKHR